MHSDLQRLKLVQNKINEIINIKQPKITPQIIVITKTWPISKILPLLENGHTHFGENKIQEAGNKWIDIKSKYKKVKLHMVGKLQTNKVKKALKLFDYIHSLDNEKLALKISQHEKNLNKNIKLFIQVNVGDESQKSGVSLKMIESFYDYCVKDLSLSIIGLMCLPPINSEPSKYFQILKNTSNHFSLKNLSMGMSADYEKAVLNGSTHLRLGTAIFGDRKV